MMAHENLEIVKINLPPTLSSKIMYGHIGKSCFDERQIEELKITYSELANTKHYMFNMDFIESEELSSKMQ